MKIVVDDKIPYIRERVEQLADEVIYLTGNTIGPEDIRDADVLVIRTRTHCDRHLLEGSRVRLIVTATIGYDHLDTTYLDKVGIQWTNCPGCNATSVAQYVRNSLFVMEQQGIIRLREATVGIVGYGHVGKAVKEALRPYVKQFLINDPFLYLNDDVRQCDVITLHTPLTYEGPHPTHHLINEAFLHNVHHHPILINAARGGVVNEDALEFALDEGRIRQAVIDTWENEPHINRRLLGKVFIGTPHIAGYSADGKANATRMALQAVAKFCGKEAPDFHLPPLASHLSTVNYELSKYNPLDDSQRLKDDPNGFESQRGNYPIRRE